MAASDHHSDYFRILWFHPSLPRFATIHAQGEDASTFMLNCDFRIMFLLEIIDENRTVIYKIEETIGVLITLD
jgi:hypothetical protein